MPHYQVRFYKDVTTRDRHSMVVEAPNADVARERVQGWADGSLELSDDELETETLEREGDVVDSEFYSLARPDDSYAVIETDADGMPL